MQIKLKGGKEETKKGGDFGGHQEKRGEKGGTLRGSKNGRGTITRKKKRLSFFGEKGGVQNNQRGGEVLAVPGRIDQEGGGMEKNGAF